LIGAPRRDADAVVGAYDIEGPGGDPAFFIAHILEAVADRKHGVFGVEGDFHGQLQAGTVIGGGDEAQGALARPLCGRRLQGWHAGLAVLRRFEKPGADAVQGVFAACESEGDNAWVGGGDGEGFGAVVFEPITAEALVLFCVCWGLCAQGEGG